jgi:predicted transcriptional regulator
MPSPTELKTVQARVLAYAQEIGWTRAEAELLRLVEKLEAVVTTSLQRATRLRQAVLQKAFTSQLCTA